MPANIHVCQRKEVCAKFKRQFCYRPALCEVDICGNWRSQGRQRNKPKKGKTGSGEDGAARALADVTAGGFVRGRGMALYLGHVPGTSTPKGESAGRDLSDLRPQRDSCDGKLKGERKAKEFASEGENTVPEVGGGAKH